MKQYALISYVAIMLPFVARTENPAADSTTIIPVSNNIIVLDWTNSGEQTDQWPLSAMDRVVTVLQQSGFTVCLAPETIATCIQELQPFVAGRFGRDAFAKALCAHLAAYKAGSQYDGDAVKILFTENKHSLDALKYYEPFGGSFLKSTVLMGLPLGKAFPRLSVRANWTSHKYSSSGGPFPNLATPITGVTILLGVHDGARPLAESQLSPTWPQQASHTDAVVAPTLKDLETFVRRIHPGAAR